MGDLFLNWLHSSIRNSERDLHVLQERMGMLSGQRKTLEETGQEFEITRERVRQIVHRCLSRLCHPVRRKLLIPFSVRLKKSFRKHGGIMTLREVIDINKFPSDLGGYSLLPAIELILYCCGGFRALDYDYESGRGCSDISSVTWHLEAISSETIKTTRKLALAFIEKEHCKYDFDELVKVVSDESGVDITTARASLRTYQLIEPDSSGLMVRTGRYLTVSSMALIALREIGVPSHFTFITEKINNRFPGRTLKPGHVHNHLMNPLFRWVDRGTYKTLSMAGFLLHNREPSGRSSAPRRLQCLRLEWECFIF